MLPHLARFPSSSFHCRHCACWPVLIRLSDCVCLVLEFLFPSPSFSDYLLPLLLVLAGHPFPKTGKSREARQVLERSLKSIPRPDHVDTIIKFGILEFKQGDVERGRTVFENVLSSYPKRVDLWSIYLDQEHRIGDEDVLRALYERVRTLNLSTKKMRFFFKRYFSFEQQYGNAKRIEHVKEMAQEYINIKKK